jgi:hypothetical protein
MKNGSVQKNRKISEKNIVDIMEERLQKLKEEKEEMEKLYGVNEENLKHLGKIKKELAPTVQNKEFKKIQKQHKLENLPSLEVKIKKETKKAYKSPDALVDSLKYEPNIDDLYDKNEFEAKFFSLESLKCPPSNSRIDDNLISSYYEYIKERFIQQNLK